jgi:hypothetical protein
MKPVPGVSRVTIKKSKNVSSSQQQLHMRAQQCDCSGSAAATPPQAAADASAVNSSPCFGLQQLACTDVPDA